MAADDPSACADEHGSSVPESASDDHFVQAPHASIEFTIGQEDDSGGSEDLFCKDSRPDDAVQSSRKRENNLLDDDIVMKDDVRDNNSVSDDIVTKDDVRSGCESDLKVRECTDGVIVSLQEAISSGKLNLEEADSSEKRTPYRNDNFLGHAIMLQDKVQAADDKEATLEDVHALDGVSKVLTNGKGAGDQESTSSFPKETESKKSLMDLPADLRKNTTVLNCTWDSPEETCTIYIVGTAHVSKESCKEVQAVIRHLKPQVVFLELCANRVAILTPQNLKVPTIHDMLDMWRAKRMNPFGILYSWFLAKVANKLEVFPGAEFRVAYEEALACGAKVTLGDRPVQITLRRTWARMSMWHKMKLIFALCTQAFFLPTVDDINNMLAEMSDSDMITLLIQEMNKSFPTLMETLVDERDLFMTAILQKVARHHSSVVVVVGKGHMPGIIKNWGKDIRIDTLLESPQGSSQSVYFKRWGTFALAIGGLVLISGIYFSKRK